MKTNENFVFLIGKTPRNNYKNASTPTIVITKMATTSKESWEFMNNEVLLTKVLDKVDSMNFPFVRSVRSGERMGIDTNGQDFATFMEMFDQSRIAEFSRAYATETILLSELSNTVIGRFIMLICSQPMWNSFKIFQQGFFNKPNHVSGYRRYTQGVQELLMDQMLRYFMFVKADWKYAQLYGSCVVSSVVFKVQYQESLRKKMLEYYKMSNQKLFANSVLTILDGIMVQQAIVQGAPKIELFPGLSVSNELARYISDKEFPLIMELNTENNPLVYARDRFPYMLDINVVSQERSIMTAVARYLTIMKPKELTIVSDMDIPILEFLPSLDGKVAWKISTPADVSFDRSRYTILQNQTDALQGHVAFIMSEYSEIAPLLNDKITAFTAMVNLMKETEIHFGQIMLAPYAENDLGQLICRTPFEAVSVDEELINQHFRAVVCKQFGLFKSESGKFVNYDTIMDERMLSKETVSVIDIYAKIEPTIFDKLFTNMGRLDKFKNLYFLLRSLKKCLQHLNNTSKNEYYLLYEHIVERGWRYDPNNKDLAHYVEFFENEDSLNRYYKRLTQTSVPLEVITMKELVESSVYENTVKSWLKTVFDKFPATNEKSFSKDLSFYACERHFREKLNLNGIREVIAVINDQPHSMALPAALLSETLVKNGYKDVRFRVFSASAQHHQINMAAMELFYDDKITRYVDFTTVLSWDDMYEAIGKLSKNYVVYVDGRNNRTNLLEALKNKISSGGIMISESKFTGSEQEVIAEERFIDFEPTLYVKGEPESEDVEEIPVEEPAPVERKVEEKFDASGRYVSPKRIVRKPEEEREIYGAEAAEAGGYRAAAVKTGENIRGYLNRVKEIIISSVKGNSFKVLDIGCGKGQDILKFNKYNNLRYLGIDQSSAEIEEAKRRLQQTKVGANIFEYHTTKDAFEASPDWLPLAKKMAPVDLISFQLSIHYAFRGLSAVQGLIKNMVSVAKNGTKVIITTLDDKQVVDRVAKAKETARGSGNYRYNGENYSIELDDYSRELFVGGDYKVIKKIAEASYDFTAFPKDEGARKATEYPVPRETFVKMMADQGFKLVDEKNAMDYEGEVQTMRKFNLTTADKDMISLYKSYVFVFGQTEEHYKAPEVRKNTTEARINKKYIKKLDYLFPDVEGVSKMDLGIWYDDEGLSFVTEHKLAKQISEWIYEMTKAKVIVDATAGLGGDSIAFGLNKNFTKVHSLELDSVRYTCLAHNVAIYGLKDKVETHNVSFLKWIENVPMNSVVYVDAPWGGSSYKANEQIQDLYLLNEDGKPSVSLKELSPMLFSRGVKTIVYKLPLNYNDETLTGVGKAIVRKEAKMKFIAVSPNVAEPAVEKLTEKMTAMNIEKPAEEDKFVLYSADNFQKKAPGGLAAESVKNANDYKELKKVENWRRLLSDDGILPEDMLIQLENGEVFVSLSHAYEYFHILGFDQELANRLRFDVKKTDLSTGKVKMADFLKEVKTRMVELKKADKKVFAEKEKQWEARQGEILNMIYERKFTNVKLANILLETKNARLYENTSTIHRALEGIRDKLRKAKNM